MSNKGGKTYNAREAMILATGPLLKKIFEAFLNKLYGNQATNIRGVPVDYFDESVLGTSKNMRRAKFNKEKILKKSELIKKIAETIEENKTDDAKEIMNILNNTETFNEFLTPRGIERRARMRGEEIPAPQPAPQPAPKKKKKVVSREIPKQREGESDADYDIRLDEFSRNFDLNDPIIDEIEAIQGGLRKNQTETEGETDTDEELPEVAIQREMRNLPNDLNELRAMRGKNSDIINRAIELKIQQIEESMPQKTQAQQARESLAQAGISELAQQDDVKTSTFGDEEPITLSNSDWKRLARISKDSERSDLSYRLREANKKALNTEIRNIIQSSQREISRNDVLFALQQYIENQEGLPMTRQKVITTRDRRVKAQTPLGALLSNQEEVIDRLEQAAQNRTANELQRQVNNTRLETNIIDNSNENTERVLQEIKEQSRQTLIEIKRGLTQQSEIIKRSINNLDISDNDKKVLKAYVVRLKKKLQTETKNRLNKIEQDTQLTTEQKRLAIEEAGNFNIPKVNDQNRRRIIEAMPENMRNVFGNSVDNLLLGKPLNINNILSSVIGLGAGIAFTPAIAPAVTTGVNALLNAFDINIDDYVYRPRQPTPIEAKEEPIANVSSVPAEEALIDDSDSTDISSDEEYRRAVEFLSLPENQADPVLAELNNTLQSLRQPPGRPIQSGVRMIGGPQRQPIANFLKRIGIGPRSVVLDQPMRRLPIEVAQPVGRLPSPPQEGELREVIVDEARQIERDQLIQRQGQRGAIGGGVGAAGMALALGQGAGGAIGAAGMGVLAGGSLATAIESYLRQRNVDPETRRGQRLYRVLAQMPARYLAPLLGVGAGALVAGGMGRISERPIEVSQDIIDQTTAELQQVGGQKNKQWAKRIIQPSTTIMDKSRQEQYADDVEFALFDYVPPTEQGNGTVKSNPLVRNQFVNHQIQMEDSGVYIPTVLFNTLVDASTLTDRQMEALFKGAPPLIKDPSYVKYNGDTFDNVAQYQMPNQENTSIGVLDPYRFYSRVDNHWSFNPDSELFTVNP